MQTPEKLVEAITELTKNGHEFFTTELSTTMQRLTGKQFNVDNARYWANKLVIKGLLDRREIAPRLYAYKKRRGVNLSTSLTIKDGEK